MTCRFSHVLYGLALCCPASARAQVAPQAPALVRALIPPLTADLATGHPSHGDERAGTPAWGVWDVRARTEAGSAEEAALRAAVLRVTGARARAPGDSIWTLLQVERAEVRGDSAVLEVDRGTRWCPRAGGPWASGYVYEYTFRRVAGRWRYVGVGPGPAIAYDPPPPPSPGTAPPPCGD